MPDLKLSKLPERTPVKLTIQIFPELSQALQEYAAIYEVQYGSSENVASLVPHMLASFIESDRGFQAARKR